MVLTPCVKFESNRAASFSLSVKLSPDVATPNMNGLFSIMMHNKFISNNIISNKFISNNPPYIVLELPPDHSRITSRCSVSLVWSAKQPKRREPRGRCPAWFICFAFASKQAWANFKQKTPRLLSWGSLLL